MKPSLIIFIKNPVLAKVKTRLAKQIGEKNALNVYQDLLEKTKEISLGLNAYRFLYYSDAIQENDNWNKRDFEKKVQVQLDLGERMKQATQEVLKMHAGKILIIGSDCYDLNTSDLESASNALDNHDVVIGPANDGGYYLIGFKILYPFLFENISWSTEKVLMQTLEQVEKNNLNFILLRELIDLDTFEDLKKSGYPNKKYDQHD